MHLNRVLWHLYMRVMTLLADFLLAVDIFKLHGMLADSRTLARSHLRPVSAQPRTNPQWYNRRIPSRCKVLDSEAQVASCFEGSSRVWPGQLWARTAQLQHQSCQYHCGCSKCWTQQEASVNALQCN